MPIDRSQLSIAPERVQQTLHTSIEKIHQAQPRFALLGEAEQLACHAVWACSEFVANFCQRHGEQFLAMLDAGRLTQSESIASLKERLHQDLLGCDNETTFMQRLRMLRQRETVRCVYREVHGLATVEETLQDVSIIAEVLVDESLRWVYQCEVAKPCGEPEGVAGRPCGGMMIWGMGKLGGRELNFSSDIDLIFVYPAAGETTGPRPIAHEQFYTRVGRLLIKLIDTLNGDGFVYRVDMRLRPFGDSGPLVVSEASIENYYLVHGREWERYALIKARTIAGDLKSGDALLDNLSGFIYRRYLDYGVIESLREMKLMIAAETQRKYSGDHIKLGSGGIREVEFIAQLFQLVHGGRDVHLRGPALKPILHYLPIRGLLPLDAVVELQAAYNFLRRTENFLQMMRDAQVHQLPESEEDRWRLASALNFNCWESFKRELDEYRQAVRQHFNALFMDQVEVDAESRPETECVSFKELWLDLSRNKSDISEGLSALGFQEDGAANVLLQNFIKDKKIKSLSTQGAKRLDHLMPHALDAVLKTDEPLLALERLLYLLIAVSRRTVYIALMFEQPQVLEHLVRLCAASAWFRDYLAAQPILMDALVDPDALYSPPDKIGLAQELTQEMAQFDADDEEQILDRLRSFKKTQVFRVAAADIVGALPVMKVSDHLTWLAEVMLDKVIELAWRMLVKKYGEPQAELNGVVYQPKIAVIGYGKLGGWEMGYGSDLDVVFLHDSRGVKQLTSGEKCVDNAVFFARLGQKIIHLLTTFTAAGDLYEVDMRLRPSGNSGLLVASLDAFRRYQCEEAWTWEHQALVRARPVAGDAMIGLQFTSIRERILLKTRDKQTLQREVRTMRERMWVEHESEQGDLFDLKKSPGGIVDIEFMVQYLVLSHTCDSLGLSRWSDNVRILETLAKAGILEATMAQALAEAYRCMRDEIHRCTLNDLPVSVAADRFTAERELVQQCWQKILVSPD